MTTFKTSKVILLVAPLAVLSFLLYLFSVDGGSLLVPRTVSTPVENLVIERLELPTERQIVLHVLNAGPREVTVSQVLVNEALWEADLDPSNTIPRLERAKVVIPFHWVEFEPYEVTLITANSLKFSAGIEAAVLTPLFSITQIWSLALIGIYVGVVPVFLGTAWFPLLSGLPSKWFSFLLSFTVGLLVFLGVSSASEALEFAGMVPQPFQGLGLVLIGFTVSFLGLTMVSGGNRSEKSEFTGQSKLLRLAYLIALGIGLHNLGEGLAIGTAYAVGEIALGAFLIIGFMIHNVTEGLAIVAPVTGGKRPPIYHFASLALLGGAPTVLGTWIGGFGATAIWAILFLSIGAGAIFQVVYAVMPFIGGGRKFIESLAKPLNLLGLTLGFLFLYVTGLWVTV